MKQEIISVDIDYIKTLCDVNFSELEIQKYENMIVDSLFPINFSWLKELKTTEWGENLKQLQHQLEELQIILYNEEIDFYDKNIFQDFEKRINKYRQDLYCSNQVFLDCVIIIFELLSVVFIQIKNYYFFQCFKKEHYKLEKQLLDISDTELIKKNIEKTLILELIPKIDTEEIHSILIKIMNYTLKETGVILKQNGVFWDLNKIVV